MAVLAAAREVSRGQSNQPGEGWERVNQPGEGWERVNQPGEESTRSDHLMGTSHSSTSEEEVMGRRVGELGPATTGIQWASIGVTRAGQESGSQMGPRRTHN